MKLKKLIATSLTMAMAFTLPGLKTGNIVIKNPGCCRKTFENYFSVIDSLY